jgi:hypothetical protein
MLLQTTAEHETLLHMIRLESTHQQNMQLALLYRRSPHYATRNNVIPVYTPDCQTHTQKQCYTSFYIRLSDTHTKTKTM